MENTSENQKPTLKPTLNIYLANPRGFCAGVDRAIKIVENAITKYGTPVYVRHEIVHNKHVVSSLAGKGAIFIDDLSEITDNTRPVIFSAHGVPKSVPADAISKNLFYIDATCPLVSKVHHEAENYAREDYHVFLVGHKGHPEVIGTIGQVPVGIITLIETEEDAMNVTPPQNDKIALITQTTLSVDDTAEISKILHQRFPKMKTPSNDDICYATTNRQMAVKEVVKKAEMVLVVGAKNSSNSIRLTEIAKKSGINFVKLIHDKSELPFEEIAKISHLGISAGASAPEILVQDIITELKKTYHILENNIEFAKENITFKLPKILT